MTEPDTSFNLSPKAIAENIAAGWASKLAERFAGKKLEATRLGAALQRAGVMDRTFSQEFRQILETALEDFFTQHPDYCVNGIQEFYLQPSIQYCFTRFFDEGMTPNNPIVLETFDNLFHNDPETRRLIQTGAFNPRQVYSQFLVHLIDALPTWQSPDALRAAIQLEDVKQILQSDLQRVEDLLRKDIFRPYLLNRRDQFTEYLNKWVRREIAIEAEDTPEAVKRPQPRRVIDEMDFQQEFTDEADSEGAPITLREALEKYNERLLVLGEPGAGKSILLRKLALEAIHIRLVEPSAPLPIFASIASWDSHNQTAFHDWLADSRELQSGDLKRAFEFDRPMLILDGLDELGSERPVDPQKPDGEKYDPRLRFMGSIPPAIRVITSCRKQDYENIRQKIDLKGAVTLRPLNDIQITTYLEAEADLLAAVKADDSLREMLRTPLMLRLFTAAFQGQGEAARQLRQFHDSPGDLRDAIFTQYIIQRYQHEERKLQLREQNKNARLRYSLKDTYRDLGWIAMRNAAGGWDVTANVLKPVDFARVVGWGEVEPFTAELVKLHILSRDASDERYSFRHLRLRDHFAYRRAEPLIKDPNRYVRDLAIAGLGGCGDSRATTLLLPWLSYRVWTVRQRAAEAVGRIGDPNSISHLLPLLTDNDPNVRASTAEALGQIGGVDTLPSLLPLLRDDALLVCDRAAYALFQIEGRNSLFRLLPLLNDYNPRIRASIVTSLGKIGDSGFVSHLLPLLRDQESIVRFSAALSLGQIGNRDNVSDLLPLLKDDDPDVCASAALSLGNIGDRNNIPDLLPLLKDDDGHVRANAASALGQIGDPDSPSHLLPLLKDEDPNVRYYTAVALSQIENVEDSASYFVSLLSDTDASVRAQSAIILRKIARKATLDLILSWLRSEEASKRAHAVSAFGWIGDSENVSDLLPFLKDSDLTVRYRTAEALGRIGNPDSLPYLLPLLKDSDLTVRYRTVQALGRVGDLDSFPRLIPLLEESAWNVQTNVKRVLETVGSEEALRALEEWEEEQDK